MSHSAIMDAVYELLQEKSARELTMEAIAQRAKVGKPTLYKWWPSKDALIMAMFHERLAGHFESPTASTAEEAIRTKMRRLIAQFNGLFGKVMADLIAEGQSDSAILQELYERHIRLRRASTVADIERGKLAGEFSTDTDAELLVDAIFAPVYYRLLFCFAPLTEKYGNDLIDQVLTGVRKKQKLSTCKTHRRLRVNPR
ncbi:MAG: TetR/AcrR family transcriptional regulator [Terracidiphilus sp.]|nr:TetR/AcrR family transcriptional regulator [Terracidiphilus sp.]MDR3776579.1 TetR/AcrR family transcriptional regulator [Terracidiphilus sp.]